MSIIPTRDTFEIELLSFYYQCLASSDQAWTKCQHAFVGFIIIIILLSCIKKKAKEIS
jgi:hypothetical protein